MLRKIFICSGLVASSDSMDQTLRRLLHGGKSAQSAERAQPDGLKGTRDVVVPELVEATLVQKLRLPHAGQKAMKRENRFICLIRQL
jgi:hypothetical protein